MSCQVTTEMRLDSKQLNPENMESKVEHRKVPMKRPQWNQSKDGRSGMGAGS
jgi:hypothetical protein